jgi:hypothetical protein
MRLISFTQENYQKKSGKIFGIKRNKIVRWRKVRDFPDAVDATLSRLEMPILKAEYGKHRR